MVGRAGVTRPQASGLSFRGFLGNRFGFQCKIAPNKDSHHYDEDFILGS